jgi:hypothetical protein
MRPTIWRWSDLSFLWVPALIVGLLAGAIVWNLVSPNGEELPWAAWFVSGLTTGACVLIVIAFYWERWRWSRLYSGTVRGVGIFYAEGARAYLVVDIDMVIERVVQRMAIYCHTDWYTIVACLRGTRCLFRPELHWNQAEMGWWPREVTGLAGPGWVMVGQGGRPVQETAFAHELAHVVVMKRFGSDETAAHAQIVAAGL